LLPWSVISWCPQYIPVVYQSKIPSGHQTWQWKNISFIYSTYTYIYIPSGYFTKPWKMVHWNRWVYLLIAWWIFPWRTVTNNQMVGLIVTLNILKPPWLGHGWISQLEKCSVRRWFPTPKAPSLSSRCLQAFIKWPGFSAGPRVLFEGEILRWNPW
jgi:hypothetical protein